MIYFLCATGGFVAGMVFVIGMAALSFSSVAEPDPEDEDRLPW